MHITEKKSTKCLLWTGTAPSKGIDKMVRKDTVAAFNDAYTVKGNNRIIIQVNRKTQFVKCHA